jgi:hypothetical protein
VAVFDRMANRSGCPFLESPSATTRGCISMPPQPHELLMNRILMSVIGFRSLLHLRGSRRGMNRGTRYRKSRLVSLFQAAEI